MKNHQESSRISENQWKSGFWLIWESIPDLFENQWESSRITENHWESARINENHWETMRINFRLIWESMRIIENQFHTYLRISENHWESLRISRNHWESTRINENHIKNKVLPLQWSKAKWHRYMKINVFIVILIDLHWYALILRIIIIFPLSQIHWIDHIAVLADSNNKRGIIVY